MLRRRFKFTIDLLIHSNSSLTLVYGGMHFQVCVRSLLGRSEVGQSLMSSEAQLDAKPQRADHYRSCVAAPAKRRHGSEPLSLVLSGCC